MLGLCEPKTAPEVSGPPAGAEERGPTIPGRNCWVGGELESWLDVSDVLGDEDRELREAWNYHQSQYTYNTHHNTKAVQGCEGRGKRWWGWGRTAIILACIPAGNFDTPLPLLPLLLGGLCPMPALAA
jgi:hypothetical protein